MIRIRIAGTDRTATVAVGTLRITREISRARARCEIVQRGDLWIPVPGSSFDIYDEAADAYLFRGFVMRTERELLIGAGRARWTVEAVDYHHILARRITTLSVENWYLPNIVSALVSPLGEGITIAPGVPNDLVAGRIDFPYVSVAQALNRLAELTGYVWYIDDAKRLHFGPLSSWSAPFAIGEAEGDCVELIEERSLEDYRNRQYVRVEIPQFPTEWTDTRIIPGPGSWMLSSRWAIMELQSVTVDGESKTFVAGDPADPTESGADFLYFPGAGGIFTLDYEAVGGETVVFTYRPGDPWGQYEQGIRVASASDDDEIARMAEISGTSGIYEAVEDTRVPATTEAITAEADARLRRYCREAVRLRVRTYSRGLVPGMRVTVSAMSISGQMIAESCDYTIRWTGDRELVVTDAILVAGETLTAGAVDFVGRVIDMARLSAGGAPGAAPGEYTTNWRGGWLLASGETARGAQTLSRSLLYGSVYGVDHTVEDDLVGRRLRRIGTDLGVER